MPDWPKIPDIGDGETVNRKFNGYPTITTSPNDIKVHVGKPGVRHKNQRQTWAEYDSAIDSYVDRYEHLLYKNQITLEGYNLASVRTVLLSTVEGQGYPTGDSFFDLPTYYASTTPSLGNKATDFTKFEFFNNNETISPGLLGWQFSQAATATVEHDPGSYRLISDEKISISLPVFTEASYISVVVMNTKSLDSVQIDVTNTDYPNQLYVRYYA